MFIYTETHSRFQCLCWLWASRMCFSISVYYYTESIVCQLNLDKLNLVGEVGIEPTFAALSRRCLLVYKSSP